jgi:hypothetical protein
MAASAMGAPKPTVAETKPEGGMINLREKMILAARTRERGAQFAVTKRTAKRRDSADDPEHKQRKPGLNVRQLKTETGKDARADDVGDNDGTRRDETDRTPRLRFHGRTLSNDGHRGIDNGID